METPPTTGEVRAFTRSRRRLSIIIVALCGLLFLSYALFIYFTMIDRRFVFRFKAQKGQPIVRAIEEFHRQTGNFPASLTNLTPKYLSAVPDMPDRTQHKFSGWDYQIVTNGTAVSYTLRYYMGKGGVEYYAQLAIEG